MNKIRVMLAEDQNLVRLGICSLLELSERIDVVGQVEDGSQVVEAIQKYRPDVLLMDIRMPKMTGIDALHAMRAAGCMVPSIILTTFDDSQLVLEGSATLRDSVGNHANLAHGAVADNYAYRVDTTPPVAGTMALANYTDSGDSDADFIAVEMASRRVNPIS
jgi:CheY-like chemotaxis protein